MITQSDDNCKYFTESGRKQYLLGFARMDYDFRNYEMTTQLKNELVDRILNGTNDQAFTILNSANIIEHIPGTEENFIPFNAIQKFYGVSEDYLKGVLTRRGFCKKKHPHDIQRTSTMELLAKSKIPLERCLLPKCNTEPDDLCNYSLKGAYNEFCVSLPKSRSFQIYSSRIVLAMALILSYADKSAGDNNIKKVLSGIKQSLYRVNKDEPHVAVSEVQATPIDVIPVNSNGEFTLSMDFFTHMLKATAKEVASAVVLEMQNSMSK